MNKFTFKDYNEFIKYYRYHNFFGNNIIYLYDESINFKKIRRNFKISNNQLFGFYINKINK